MSEQEKRVSRVGKAIEQATAVFEGAEITAVRAEDGFVYASLPHLCRALGLDGESHRQLSRLQRSLEVAITLELSTVNFIESLA